MTPGVPGWWAVALRQRRQARSVRVSTVRQMIRSRHLDFPHKTKCEPSRRLSADPVNIVVSALGFEDRLKRDPERQRDYLLRQHG